MSTIADLTERDLIDRIAARLPPPPSWLLVGIGDDAAVVEPERNKVDVLSVDACVEGVHFDRHFTPPDAVGHRALAANLSDLAAMGAAPRLALLSLALPPGLPLEDFDGIAAGITSLASRHHLHVVGGNLTRSTGPLVIDITVVGTVKRRQVLTRSGARPGDEIYVSGTIGGAAAGLQILKDAKGTKDTEDGKSSAFVSCTSRYLRPDPRVRLGVLLSRNRAATACMDLSDGLADAVRQVARASGVGAILDADALPIDDGARAWFAARAADPVMAALSGGDDYELLVAVRGRMRNRLAALAGSLGAPLTRVGVFTEDHALIVRRPAADATLPQGVRSFPMIRLTKTLIKRWLEKLLHVHDTPQRTAAAFALGVFCGFNPFMGLHTVMGLGLAFLLNLNRVAALLGVYSNLPWVIVPYYVFTTMAVGAPLTGYRVPPGFEGQIASLLEISFFQVEFWHRMAVILRPWLLPYLVGSTLGAIALAAAAYPLALAFVTSQRRIHDILHHHPPASKKR